MVSKYFLKSKPTIKINEVVKNIIRNAHEPGLYHYRRVFKKKKKNWISCQNCKERFVQAYEKHTTVPISAYDSTRPFSRTGWSVPKGWPYYPSPTETL